MAAEEMKLEFIVKLSQPYSIIKNSADDKLPKEIPESKDKVLKLITKNQVTADRPVINGSDYKTDDDITYIIYSTHPNILTFREFHDFGDLYTPPPPSSESDFGGASRRRRPSRKYKKSKRVLRRKSRSTRRR